MSEQSVVAIQDVSDGVLLMRHQGYLRRHTDKTDMRAVVLTRPDAVEKLIVSLT